MSYELFWRLKKNIRGYAVILPFHDFHLEGQTKVKYVGICFKTPPFRNEIFKQTYRV